MFIQVVPYDSFWEAAYENEAQKISSILKDILVEIYHIGSTAHRFRAWRIKDGVGLSIPGGY